MAAAMVLEAMDVEEAEDGGPITKSASAARPAAEMPAAGEALVLVQRPMTGGSTEPMILTILEQPDAK